MLVTCLLLPVYFFALLFLIKKNKFIENSGLSSKLIVLLFTGKIAIGFIYIFLEAHFLQGGDLEGVFFNSLNQTALLKKDPLHFVTSIFQSDYDNYTGLYNSRSYWNDLRNVFLEKTIGVFNIFSFNNLYIDALFYNFFIFFGHIALYRTFINIWPKLKTPVLAGCFFIPGSMFFLSGINKDSMVFLSVSVVLFAVSSLSVALSRSSKIKHTILLLTGLFLLFIIRNFFFTALIPVLLAYYAAGKANIRPVYIFSAVLALVAVVFFLSPALMNVVCVKQADFLQLGWAKSAIPVTALEPNFTSFVQHLPLALNIAFLRPYVWDSYSVFYFASAFELLILVVLVVVSVIVMIKSGSSLFNNRLVLLCLFFALVCLLIIGYTIPILGAVTRYRSAFLPLVITPFLCVFNWEKMKWLK
jgi:hypothetical protein